jgi:hypothetical protein
MPLISPVAQVRAPLSHIFAGLVTVLTICRTSAMGMEIDPTGCLNAVTSGTDRVEVSVCNDADTLNLSESELLKQIILSMQLNPSSIRFRGCKQRAFSTTEYRTPSGNLEYLIEYPDEKDATLDAYLAPIVHELAHVLQMHSYGGYELLRRETNYDSKRVELGADYITGLVYALNKRLSDTLRPGHFQHNFRLMGLYVERSHDAHGTPSQRTAAFRNGWVNSAKQTDVSSAHRFFQADRYAEISAM